MVNRSLCLSVVCLILVYGIQGFWPCIVKLFVTGLNLT